MWSPFLQWLVNLVGEQLCDMACIVPMHVKPKFTYLLTFLYYSDLVYEITDILM